MDTRLLEAAQTGNIQYLNQLLAENPYMLHTMALASEQIKPLDIASTAGHVEFVKEIIRLRPDLAREVNQDGFSPMHIASAIGNLEIVRELLKVEPKLSRLEGRNRWTPLHYAASRGKVDIIREMLSACPESIGDVNVQKESALHLAVKNSQFEEINFIVKWIREMKKEVILDMKDELGNSVVEWLIGNNIGASASIGVVVNAVNKSGLTALDVLLIFPSEAGDREIEEILKTAGARRARDINILTNNTTTVTPTPFERDNQIPTNFSSHDCDDDHGLVKYFKFKRGRDSPSDARTALLVIAVLVTTATFQASLNPPGGVWQDSSSTTTTTTALNGTQTPVHLAGRSILGSYSSVTYLFAMIFNTIGFSVSLYVISILIGNFPFQLEFQVCITALYVTYNTSITFMAPDNMKVALTAFSSALPPAVPLLASLFRALINTVIGLFTHLKHRLSLFCHTN
ncbi:hypothetical protein FNV43_RR24314 [Rhamnella rubrinervis]|uniref:PGG domain-containing protein n=1 Tax=Rhamnella rubrinervis TaxID=2594499 RepID=A0A8K0GL35_9ROSA|nr:hypothetical protein FNV43_RR24314 [Rhamnella rubrinervis]